jgi:hypothetical protein
MFAIHDVFEPSIRLPKIQGLVRVIDTVGSEEVILIPIGEKANSLPFAVSYRDWLEYLKSGALRRTTDPYLNFSTIARDLPEGAAERYKRVLEVTGTLARDPSLLHSPKKRAKAIADIAQSTGRDGKTIKRWVCEWLRFGRNPAAVVRVFLERDSDQLLNPQTKGKKRGVKGGVPEFASDVPSPEVMSKIKGAWDLYLPGVPSQKTTLHSSRRVLRRYFRSASRSAKTRPRV